MRIEKVVINASPFILLCKSGLDDLLPELFSEICMPERVLIEIIEGNDSAAEKLREYEKNGSSAFCRPWRKRFWSGTSAAAKPTF